MRGESEQRPEREVLPFLLDILDVARGDADGLGEGLLVSWSS